MSTIAPAPARRSRRRAPKPEGYVYVLHFREALAGGKKASRHYVGWSRNWIYRVQSHRQGTSRARIMEVLHERGITFEVALVVKGSPAVERRIKASHHHARYCPICGGHKLADYRD